jgi:hypothetical protein
MTYRPPIENWTLISIDRRFWCEAIEWCHEHFDYRPGATVTWLYYGQGEFELQREEFVFKREEDAVLFALRWA